MPEKIVLTYFKGRGKAELARLILAQGGIDYEDRRVTQEEWKELKSESPTGQVPMLEVNGIKICQSVAIANFLARRYGLSGKNEFEAAQAEMIVHTGNDIITKGITAFTEKDADRRAKMLDEYNTEYLPPQVAKLEAILTANGGEWMIGDKITWADLSLIEIFGPENLPKHVKNIDWDKTAPKLIALVTKVRELPKIKSWLEKRPETPF